MRKPWVKTYSRLPKYELTLTSGGPSFSPMGDRFAFVGPAENAMGAGLAVAEVGSTTSTIVYRDPARNVLGPQWSPDGERLIFGIGTFDAFFNGFHGLFLKPEDRVEGGAQVAIVNADGTGFRELTSGPNNNGFPSMAPDGHRFVYRTFGPEGEGLRIMDIETKQVTSIAERLRQLPAVVAARRSDHVLRAGRRRLRDLHHQAGRHGRQAADAHARATTRTWPGRPMARTSCSRSTRMGFKDEATYTDAPQPYGEIFVMRADGTDVQQLTDNQWEEGTPAWQPARKVSTQ